MKLAYCALWYLKCRFLGKRIPLFSVFFITSKCNLKCRHCAVRLWYEPSDMRYPQIMELMRRCYDMGARMIFFEGGEPFLWNDAGRRVNDLVRESKSMGFFMSSLTTNATMPFETDADLVWVSVDGTKEIHDEIRGRGTFEQLMKNVENSSHPRICANMVINTLNRQVVEDTIRLIARTQNFKGISLNFHTPHSGVEELFLPFEQRREVLQKIIELKREGFPIINSLPALEAMGSNDWVKRRQCWVGNFVLLDGVIYEECSGSREGICDRCGYGMGAEMTAIFDFKPSTIREATSLFFKGQS